MYRRNRDKRADDESFGRSSAERLATVWLKIFGGVISPTTYKYSGIDAVWTAASGDVLFLEYVGRRINKDKYKTAVFDKRQYERIVELNKITGFKTILLIEYTDGVCYTELPNSNIFEVDDRLEIGLDNFVWLA